MGNRRLDPFFPGIESSIESTGLVAGTIFEFDGTTLGFGPKNTTLTFARLVFQTTLSVNTDGEDIVHDPFFTIIGGNAPGSVIADAIFIGAAVNLVPEPGTVVLLGLGIGCLALAGRGRGRK